MSGPLRPELGAPGANGAVFSQCDDGAVMVGADVGDGSALPQRLGGGRQSESHLLAASRTLLLLLVLLQHVSAELTLHHITKRQ